MTHSETDHLILHPSTWKQARGYANGIAAEGRMIFVGGQVGWTGGQVFEAKDLAGQTRQVLMNIVAVLAEAGASPRDVVRMTWYITDKADYLESLKEIGAAYREVMGKHYPAMTMVQVAALIEDEAKVEIEATAIKK